MKNLLIVLAVVAGIGFFLVSRKSDAEVMADATRIMVDSCKETAGTTPNFTADTADKFCRCAADEALTAFGADGIRKLDKNGKLTAPEQKIVEQAAATCIGKLLAE